MPCSDNTDAWHEASLSHPMNDFLKSRHRIWIVSNDSRFTLDCFIRATVLLSVLQNFNHRSYVEKKGMSSLAIHFISFHVLMKVIWHVTCKRRYKADVKYNVPALKYLQTSRTFYVLVCWVLHKNCRECFQQCSNWLKIRPFFLRRHHLTELGTQQRLQFSLSR